MTIQAFVTWLKTSVQGLASRRIWGYMSLESQVGCGNGISASWEDGKVHHLLLLSWTCSYLGGHRWFWMKR